MMRMSRQGMNWLVGLEGLSRTVYLDSGGAPTIGVGHLLTKSERASGKIRIGDKYVRFADGLTDEQCLELLKQDLSKAEDTVYGVAPRNLPEHQFNALVSFVFNVGTQAFIKSTLLKKLCAGKMQEVPEQFMRWVYDNRVFVPGLENRRKAEVAMWLGQTN